MATAKVVYASMTGNTEECAQIVADKLTALGLDVELSESTQADPEDYADVDLCIAGTYTYGDGELPDEIVDFYEDLADIDLSGKIYAVFGSGDTFYDDFCYCVDQFDEQFAQTGATKGAESVKVDLSPDEDDIVNLVKFAETLAAKVQ